MNICVKNSKKKLLKIGKLWFPTWFRYERKTLVLNWCFVVKLKQNITAENLFWRNMSVAFKLCKLRNNNIKFKPHDQLEPGIMKVNQMMFLASFWTSRGAPSSEVYQFLVSCIDKKWWLKEKMYNVVNF